MVDYVCSKCGENGEHGLLLWDKGGLTDAGISKPGAKMRCESCGTLAEPKAVI